MNHKVFVNRILNMKKIKYIGLDMDHTLIRYNTQNFEALVFKLVINKLIEQGHYPEALRSFVFNFDDAIRGLVVDSRNGNLLKLTRYAAIQTSYHGTRPIHFSEQNKIYRSTYVDLNDSNYVAIDTSFSIAFAVILGQLIDYKDANPGQLPSYYEITTDVLKYVDLIHADGSLKKIVSENMADYVLQDKAVVDGLKWYIRHGKTFFILTNSDYAYTRTLLDYAITPFLDEHEHWTSLFSYIITLANKPRFFYDNLRFLKINPQDGSMTNLQGSIVPGIYQGGGAKKFTQDLAIEGDEILYIGDHIYGDIVRLKKDCNWRTALVVEELGEEIASQVKAMPTEIKLVEAMNIKKALDQQYNDLITLRIDEHSRQYDDAITALHQQLQAQDFEISKLLEQQHQSFNPHWDRVFRAGAQESYFAYQVERFACVYMEKLADLLGNSPLTYYRPNRRPLPHDTEMVRGY